MEQSDMTRLIGMNDTQSNVESNSAKVQEILFAFATDTLKFGVFVNGTWHWFSFA